MRQGIRHRFHTIRTIQIALPIMLGHLGHILTGIADSAMVGRIGPTSLAGAALGNSSLGIFLMFGIGISFAITPMVASDSARRNSTEIEGWLRNGLFMNLLTGMGLFALVIAYLPVIDYLDQPEAVVLIAKPYLVAIAASMIPLMLFQHYKQFAEGLSYTKVAMYISLGGNLFNILLNYVLIFGVLGFPRLELLGAGIATLIARCLMAFAMFWYVYRSHRFQAYRGGFVLNRYKLQKIKRLWNLGYPIGFQYVFEVGAFVMAAYMVGWLGEIPLAAHQIALTLAAATYMAASGIGSAATVRVGNYAGGADLVNLRRAATVGYSLVIAFMSVTALLFVLLRNILPPLFTLDAEVQQVTAGLLILAAIFQLSDGIQVVGLSILRGMKDVKFPTIIAMVSYWLVGIPVAYVVGFVFDLGVNGVWIGLAAGLTTSAFFMYLRYRQQTSKFAKQVAARTA